MIALLFLAVAVVVLFCTLAYTLATYALPFMLGLSVARFAYDTGASVIGAGFVGLVAATIAFAILAFLFATLRSPVLRFLVMLVFVVPSAMAGYLVVHGIAREAVPSVIWQQIF
ncbi:MAG: hypothetical protein WCC64_10095, partial [Aliidongia sp.]